MTVLKRKFGFFWKYSIDNAGGSCVQLHLGATVANKASKHCEQRLDRSQKKSMEQINVPWTKKGFWKNSSKWCAFLKAPPEVPVLVFLVYLRQIRQLFHSNLWILHPVQNQVSYSWTLQALIIGLVYIQNFVCLQEK